MNIILGIGILLVTIALGYFLESAADKVLDKILKRMVVNHYRQQTRTAIMEVLSKATK